MDGAGVVSRRGYEPAVWLAMSVFLHMDGTGTFFEWCVWAALQVTPSTKAQELLAASKDDADMRAAERASKQLLASILGKKAAGAPTQQFYSTLLVALPCHVFLTLSITCMAYMPW